LFINISGTSDSTWYFARIIQVWHYSHRLYFYPNLHYLLFLLIYEHLPQIRGVFITKVCAQTLVVTWTKLVLRTRSFSVLNLMRSELSKQMELANNLPGLLLTCIFFHSVFVIQSYFTSFTFSLGINCHLRQMHKRRNDASSLFTKSHEKFVQSWSIHLQKQRGWWRYCHYSGKKFESRWVWWLAVFTLLRLAPKSRCESDGVAENTINLLSWNETICSVMKKHLRITEVRDTWKNES